MPTLDPGRLRVFAAALGLKLALAPGYRSTDFEVHRNWLAVTRSLPLRRWYTDATSQWTLDYPPLFAYFERFLAAFAAVLAPESVVLRSDPVEDAATVAFQRLSVALFADVALAAVAWRLASDKKNDKFPPWVPFALLFASPGLIIVDSIHFQYNSPLIALLLASVSLAQKGSDVASAALFAALVCSKHLFACLGPLFALHLLGRCLGRGRAALDDGGGGGGGGGATRTTTEGRDGVSPRRLVRAVAAAAKHALALAASVAAVLAVAFGPFLLSRGPEREGGRREGSTGRLSPIFSRLFPFDRGLLHAYWAANAWALLAGLDVAASAALRALVPRLEGLSLLSPSSALSAAARRSGSGLASGLVQRTKFAVFPSLTPSASFAALSVLFAQAPALFCALRSGYDSARKEKRKEKGKTTATATTATPSFASAAQYCLLCSFVWGYHVHEKAVLPALSLSAWRAFAGGDGEGREGDGEGREGDDDGRGVARGPVAYALLSLPALHALLPLLAPAPAERAAAFLLLVVHALFLLSVLPRGFSKTLVAAVAAALCSLEVFCAFAWPVAFPRLAEERLPFLPLALTSLACALGVCGCWLSDFVSWSTVAVGGGGSGGRRRQREQKRDPAVAAVVSASPPLATRRPRRATAAASSK